VAWSPDGVTLASGSADKTIKVWNTTNGKCHSTLTGHSRSVEFVAWNNDGSKLATGSRDATIRIWAVGSAGTFECQSTLKGHLRYVTAVSYSCLFSNV
jgi:WD40 repeat protein